MISFVIPLLLLSITPPVEAEGDEEKRERYQNVSESRGGRGGG